MHRVLPGLVNTPHTHNYIMSTGSGDDGSPSRGEPRSTPRAIQLTVKYPTFNWDQGDPHEQLKWLNIELKYSWRDPMRIIRIQIK